MIPVVLGHPTYWYGISAILPAPSGDRRLANYRIYCDNDVRDLNGSSRWKLRGDPPMPPAGYIPQRERPSPGNAQPGELWQEWVDYDNGILMGKTDGCQAPSVPALTYNSNAPQIHLRRHREVRATITVRISWLIDSNLLNRVFYASCATVYSTSTSNLP